MDIQWIFEFQPMFLVDDVVVAAAAAAAGSCADDGTGNHLNYPGIYAMVVRNIGLVVDVVMV